MSLSLLLVSAFLLGVLVARLAGWWFVVKALGLMVWMVGHVLVLHGTMSQLRRALDAEEKARLEALRRAQMELASQVGSRRWP